MSKFAGSQFDVLLVDGYNLAASLTEAVTMGKEIITQQTNPFGAPSEQHNPVGLDKGYLTSGGGFYNEAQDELHVAMNPITGIRRVICAAIFGNTIGQHFMGFEGAYTQKYEVMDKRDDLVRAAATYLVSGAVETGVIVQHLLQFSADWDTKTGGANATDAPVDYTLDTMQGAQPITSNSIANPTVVTCLSPHNLVTGQKILISGVATSTPTINGERVVTVISPTTFSVPVNVTVAGTGGTFVLADSQEGGSGYIQVTQFAGLTNLVGKIMHSPDDTTYAALITFATVTGITKERKTVTGVVDRYLSFNGDVTGAGTVTVFAGFCRNGNG